MKRITAGLIAVLLLLCIFPASVFAVGEEPTVPASAVWDGTIATSFAGGSGSVFAPYRIETAEQLAYLAKVFNESKATYQGLHYRLEQDIYLNDVSTDPSTWREWTPINSFEGYLDGNGYAIYGMKVTGSFSGSVPSTDARTIALIKETTGVTEICDLAMVSARVYIERTGTDTTKQSTYAAILVGQLKDTTTISGCYVDGSMEFNNPYTTIARIRGGGIAGYVHGSKSAFINCAVTGSAAVTAGGNSVQFGAIAFGDWATDSTHTYQNCYSTMVIGSKVENKLISSKASRTKNTYSGLYSLSGCARPTSAWTTATYLDGGTITADSVKGAGAMTNLSCFDFQKDWFVYDQNSVALPRTYGLRRAGIPIYGTGKVFSGGTGTMEDPYVIASAQDLNLLSQATATGTLGSAEFQTEGKYFVLGQDITYYQHTAAQLYGMLSDAPSFAPIGTAESPFRGTFDGAGHRISGLYVRGDAQGSESYGLFGTLSNATVKNLSLTNTCIKITSSAASAVGGVAGVSKGNTRILDCYFDGILSAPGVAGGIVGDLQGGSVTRCGTAGSIQGQGGYFAGKSGSGTVMVDCYSCTTMTTVSSAESNGTYENCFAVGGNSLPAGCTAQASLATTKEALEGKFAFDPEGALLPYGIVNYSPISVWNGSVANGFAGGSGTQTDPYLIANGAQLAYLGVFSAGTADTYYKLTADIALNGTAQADWYTYAHRIQWIPLGTDASPVKGHFNGNGKTISGLYLCKEEGVSATDAFGLFGVVSDLEISNVHLEQAYLSFVTPAGGTQAPVSTCVGGLVGKATGSTFFAHDCMVDATILIRKDHQDQGGAAEAGGLLGYANAESATIQACGFSGSLTCLDGHGGEFAGAATRILVEQCWSSATVQGNRTAIAGSVVDCYAAQEGYLSVGGAQDTTGVAAGAITLVPKAEMQGALAVNRMPKLFRGQWLVKREGGAPIPYGWVMETSQTNIWDGTVADSFAGGSGTQADPYLIANGAQFARFGQLVTAGTAAAMSFRLTEDIYLNHSAVSEFAETYTGFPTWTTVTGFKGTLDGNGKAVIGLYMYDTTVRAEQTSQGIWGMFGNFGAGNRPTIQNLAVLDSVIYMPNTYFVSVLGWGEPYIYNCYIECDMTVAARSGIVQAWAGGIVKNTVATGTLTATNLGTRCGAFAEAYNADTGEAPYTNCISLVKTNTEKFGFIGQIDGTISKTQFNNCYLLQPNGDNPLTKFAPTAKTYTVTLGGNLAEEVTALLGNATGFGTVTNGNWITEAGKLPLNQAFATSPFAAQMRTLQDSAAVQPVEMTVTGASVHLNGSEPKYGMQIHTQVELNAFTEAYGITAADFASAESFYEKYKDQIYFGTLFLPLDKLGQTRELTHATASVLDRKAQQTTLDGTTVSYACQGMDLTEADLSRPMIARSYVAYRIHPYSQDWTVVYAESFGFTYMGAAAEAYADKEGQSPAFLAQLEAEFTQMALENYGAKLNGVSLGDYRIVISDTADIYLWQSALTLQRKLIEICGKTLPIVSDTEPANGKEIWLGESDRTANVTLPADLNTAVYGVEGNNLYLEASHYYALYCAVEDFCSALSSQMTNTFQGTLTNVSDVPLTLANNTGYTLVWNDEFNDTSLNLEKWSFNNNMEIPGTQNITDERACRMVDGNLVMITDIDDPEARTYTTNYSVTTHDTMNFSGGYLEMRAKVPFYGMGEWPSFWATSGDSALFNACYTVPNGVTPVQAGATKAKDVKGYAVEVDFFEVFSSTGTCAPNMHRWYSDYVKVNYQVNSSASFNLDGRAATGGVSGNRYYQFSAGGTQTVAEVARGYHTYGFLWTPQAMTFSVDGNEYYSYALQAHADSVFCQTLTKRTTKDSSLGTWLNNKLWDPNAPATLEMGLDGFAYENMALSVILTNQLFTEAYGASGSWANGKKVDLRNDASLFPITYTVDYVRLYQTAGDILYLPEVYGEGTLMYERGRDLEVTKIVQG